jgi:hypothetical protein
VTVDDKIKKLVRVAQERGHLTYAGLNEEFPDTQFSPTELDRIYTKLRNLGVEIIDQIQMEDSKQP